MGQRHRRDEVLLKPRLDRGLDLLDAPHHLLDLGARPAVEQRDPGAGAGGIAAAETLARSQSGISPRIIAYLTSMWLPKAPASVMRSTRSTPR